ncbi:MAG: hypothetical protein U5N85_13995 [Arcicella sp.]|nr:hypothetical protein [Arcicella sp.]
MVKELNLEPIARMVTYTTAGVEPKIMGITFVAAIPLALKKMRFRKSTITNQTELNEAFAARVLAVIKELDSRTC